MARHPLKFQILHECKVTKARTSLMTLPHHVVDTPVFMPVGTQVSWPIARGPHRPFQYQQSTKLIYKEIFPFPGKGLLRIQRIFFFK